DVPVGVANGHAHLERVQAVVDAQLLELRPGQGRVGTRGIVEVAVAINVPGVGERVAVRVRRGRSVQAQRLTFGDGMGAPGVGHRWLHLDGANIDGAADDALESALVDVQTGNQAISAAVQGEAAGEGDAGGSGAAVVLERAQARVD